MHKLLKLVLAAAVLGLVGVSKSSAGWWPSSTDSVYAADIPLTTGQVTVTDVTVSTSAVTTVAANADRVYWYACVVAGTTGRIFYDPGTVSTTLSPYVVAGSTTSTNGNDRCFTVNRPGFNWQGAIQMKATTAGVAIRHYQFTR